MPRLIVQVYEIQTPHEAEALARLGVDHIGSVVLSETDWKNPRLRDTVAAVHACGSRSSLIPLFRTADAVLRVLDYYRPDIVHFCDALPAGADPAAACSGLIELQVRVKRRFPETAVMRSIPVGPPGFADRLPILQWAECFEPATDFFLTDTLLAREPGSGEAEQPVEGFVGITGRPCDWAAAGRLVARSRIPVIVAGGLSPQNVGAAIAATLPAGVDSCTLTNAVDDSGRPVRFRKDLAKVAAFVEAARRAEPDLWNEAP